MGELLKSLAMKHLSAGAGGAVDHATFNSLVGLRLEDWNADYARIELDLRPEHQNGVGSVHGGVLMSLLDTVSGFSGVYPKDGEEPRGCATVSMNVKFMKPATKGKLIAESRSQGGGRSIFFTHAEIRDEAGELIATGDGTFRYRPLVLPASKAAE
ncbi:MAG TPA: PaaI family thioesterase [Candidatus Sulfotelmatobacter sp.]|jgi:uncharacterized protein (TIGR00369 family)|nr:PaaI family thioesterase [Candidatus Sulfotelmatobacter sp.]